MLFSGTYRAGTDGQAAFKVSLVYISRASKVRCVAAAEGTEAEPGHLCLNYIIYYPDLGTECQ